MVRCSGGKRNHALQAERAPAPHWRHLIGQSGLDGFRYEQQRLGLASTHLSKEADCIICPIYEAGEVPKALTGAESNLNLQATKISRQTVSAVGSPARRRKSAASTHGAARCRSCSPMPGTLGDL